MLRRCKCRTSTAHQSLLTTLGHKCSIKEERKKGTLWLYNIPTHTAEGLYKNTVMTICSFGFFHKCQKSSFYSHERYKTSHYKAPIFYPHTPKDLGTHTKKRHQRLWQTKDFFFFGGGGVQGWPQLAQEISLSQTLFEAINWLGPLRIKEKKSINTAILGLKIPPLCLTVWILFYFNVPANFLGE